MHILPRGLTALLGTALLVPATAATAFATTIPTGTAATAAQSSVPATSGSCQYDAKHDVQLCFHMFGTGHENSALMSVKNISTANVHNIDIALTGPSARLPKTSSTWKNIAPGKTLNFTVCSPTSWCYWANGTYTSTLRQYYDSGWHAIARSTAKVG